MTLTFKQQVSRTLIQLSQMAPFFSVMAFFAPVKPTDRLETAGTDGKTIYLNPTRWSLLTDAQRRSVFCHELLHAALLHLPRCQHREKRLWNISADIVVNGILASEHFDLSLPHIRRTILENLPVEEVYQRLQHTNEFAERSSSDIEADMIDSHQPEELAHYWQHAIETALKICGSMPGRMRREYAQREQASKKNWRDLLWRYLTPSKHDYAGYDRRFVSQDLYLDALDGEAIRAALAIDTSGSIDEEELSLFQKEIQTILGAYPCLELTLYYADTELYGPYHLNNATRNFPEPEGGGGTDFVPFFDALQDEQVQVAIYLTDGWGEFPEKAPDFPVLWVMTPSCYDQVPFGEVVQLHT
jgi:predicted metal-dependent peptidase